MEKLPQDVLFRIGEYWLSKSDAPFTLRYAVARSFNDMLGIRRMGYLKHLVQKIDPYKIERIEWNFHPVPVCKSLATIDSVMYTSYSIILEVARREQKHSCIFEIEDEYGGSRKQKIKRLSTITDDKWYEIKHCIEGIDEPASWSDHRHLNMVRLVRNQECPNFINIGYDEAIIECVAPTMRRYYAYASFNDAPYILHHHRNPWKNDNDLLWQMK